MNWVIIVWVGFVWISNLALGMDLFEASSYGQLGQNVIVYPIVYLRIVEELDQSYQIGLVCFT